MKQSINLRLACIQFFILAAYASYFNFFILYLKDQGFSTFICGVIQGLIALLACIYQPVLGHIVDRYLGYRKTTVLMIFILIAFSLTIPFLGNVSLLIALFVVCHAVIMRQLPSLIDGWTVAIKAENSHINYEKTRSLGSIGAGATSVVMGLIITYGGYDTVFPFNVLLVVFAYFFIRPLHDPKILITKKQHTLKGNLSVLLHNPTYITFIISAFFLSISIKIINTFGPLMMQEIGGDSAIYGYTMFLCGIIEALAFFLILYLLKYFSYERIFVLTLVIQALSSILMFGIHTLSLFIIGRCLAGMTYSLYLAIAVNYVRLLIKPEYFGFSLGLLMSCTGGIAQIFSSFFGGLMLEVLSFNQVNIIMLALMFIAFVTFIPNLKHTSKAH